MATVGLVVVVVVVQMAVIVEVRIATSVGQLKKSYPGILARFFSLLHCKKNQFLGAEDRTLLQYARFA